jgi:hypothetical protein
MAESAYFNFYDYFLLLKTFLRVTAFIVLVEATPGSAKGSTFMFKYWPVSGSSVSWRGCWVLVVLHGIAVSGRR